MALIDCPECGTQVSSNAPACPSCGAPISTAPPRASTPQAGQRKRANNRLLNVVLVVASVLVVLAYVGSGSDEGDGDVTREYVTERPKPIKAANALDMVRDVKANEVAFEAAWEGKRPRITGHITDVQADIGDGRLLLGKRWEYVSCNDIPKEQLLHLRKGQTATVLCDDVSEVIGSAVASDCVVESVNP